MQWDDKKGKYVKPFTKKRIELLPHLYLEGYRLYWDFPRPISMVEFNKIHTWEEDASEEERKIKEVNSGVYVLKKNFVLDRINKINSENG